MEQKKRPVASSSAKRPAKDSGKSNASLLGWLGRQVGHVKNAVKEDVTRRKPAKPARASRPVAKAQAAGRPVEATARSSGTVTGATEARVIYREDKIEEADLPDRPGMRLRRTIIDEVVVEVEEKGPDK